MCIVIRVRALTLPVLCLVLLLSISCVERRLQIRTEPEGALIRVNGREIGRSPVDWRFQHYGTVRVEAEFDGYLPAQVEVRLKTPWYEYPVADLFSDVLVPTTIKDNHEVVITLEPRVETTKEEDLATAAEVGDRAASLRDRMRAELATERAAAARQAKESEESGS